MKTAFSFLLIIPELKKKKKKRRIQSERGSVVLSGHLVAFVFIDRLDTGEACSCPPPQSTDQTALRCCSISRSLDRLGGPRPGGENSWSRLRVKKKKKIPPVTWISTEVESWCSLAKSLHQSYTIWQLNETDWHVTTLLTTPGSHQGRVCLTLWILPTPLFVRLKHNFFFFLSGTKITQYSRNSSYKACEQEYC